MKRSVKMVLTLFVLVSVCLAPMFSTAQAMEKQSALADPDALQATSVTFDVGSNGLVLRMSFENRGEASIDEFGVALAFSDANGKRIYAYADTLDSYIDEVCNWYYTPENIIKSGKTYRTEDTFTGYDATASVEVAVRYYRKDGGEYIFIPESEWVWFQSGSKADANTVERSYYTEPGEDVYTLCKKVNLGYKYYLLDDYNAEYYAFNQGGEWLTEVDTGSLADTAGLMVGDLVIFADGVKPTENMYAVEYALAKVAGGETVEWIYERGGKIYSTKMAQE